VRLKTLSGPRNSTFALRLYVVHAHRSTSDKRLDAENDRRRPVATMPIAREIPLSKPLLATRVTRCHPFQNRVEVQVLSSTV